MASAHGTARRAEICCVAGGGALLASAFLHWVRRGAGSSLRGHDLIDTIVDVGRDVGGVSAANLTVLWYLVPALGALTWTSVGLTGVASRATRVVAAAGTIAATLTVIVFGRLIGAANLGAGALLALLGAGLLLAGVIESARMRPAAKRRARSSVVRAGDS